MSTTEIEMIGADTEIRPGDIVKLRSGLRIEVAKVLRRGIRNRSRPGQKRGAPLVTVRQRVEGRPATSHDAFGGQIIRRGSQ